MEDLDRQIAEAKGFRQHANAWWRPDGSICGGEPHWCDNIAAAWELVEEMVDGGACPWLRFSNVTNQWHVSTQRGRVIDCKFAAEAICLAWLTWKAK